MHRAADKGRETAENVGGVGATLAEDKQEVAFVTSGRVEHLYVEVVSKAQGNNE